MTTTVDISTLQGIRELLLLLETDAEIILTEGDIPVAMLASMKHVQIPTDGRVPDTDPTIWISDDFDDQLPEHYWIRRTL